MSYDLVVFSKNIKPRREDEFVAWYKEQVKWKETHGYTNPKIAVEDLRNWYSEMTNFYIPLHGTTDTQFND